MTETVSWTRRQMFETLRQEFNSNLDNQIEILGKRLIDREAGSYVISTHSRGALKKVLCTMKSKWKEIHYNQERFSKKYATWLDNFTSITILLPHTRASNSTNRRSSFGRPKASFSESSDRSKRRKTEKLRQEYSTEELSYAAMMSLRSDGAVAASRVVQDVTMTSPTQADKYRQAMRAASKPMKVMSADAALSFILDTKLTKRQYMKIRQNAKACNSPIYPPYLSIIEARKRCYPDSINVNETS